MSSFTFKWAIRISKPPANCTSLKQSGVKSTEHAAKISRAVRSELLHSNQLGAPVVNGAAPYPYRTIDGAIFNWFCRVFFGSTSDAGAPLKTQFQDVCESGEARTNGAIVPEGFPGSSTKTSSDFRSDELTTHRGINPDDCNVHCTTSLLFSNGVIAGDVKSIEDGVIAGDAIGTSTRDAGSLDEKTEASA